MNNIDESQDIHAPKDAPNFRFIIQDRPVVIGLGLAAWRSQCPEMLESGRVVFQDHDFFQPQPPLSPPHLKSYAAIYLLRVVLHDWPDEFARRILVNLRRTSGPETKLLIADHVLPLVCWTLDSVLAHLEGAESALAMPPLLPNLGKATANAYWMDLLMHITFNGKERTLRELCALALSAGWRVARMSRSEGSMFAYLVCVPI
ncbi:S-adenosyl-L-methionine-dependent methyltransferase, partial [Phlebopus sp. FC_14]